MAIISFTNYKRTQTRGTMGAVIRYTMQEKKTLWQGQRLVSGVNCSPESVYSDFLNTKLLYHKDNGVMFFHMVQSFPKDEQIDPVTAHAAALELAEFFKDHEVLVCTHSDRDHIHSHFLINSVRLEDGKKLHISENELIQLRQRNDQVCMKFDLPVFQRTQKKKQVKSVSNAEYHAAAKGESWKFRLINTIDECMRYASTKEEFISLMESEGYGVRWTDSRKNITYTTPGGMKCRDDRLHDERYLKGAMEHEFRIRAEIISGGIEAAKHAANSTGAGSGTGSAAGTASHGGGMGRAAEYAQRAVSPDGGTVRPSGEASFPPDHLCNEGTDDSSDKGSCGDSPSARTGWEVEREAFLSAKHQTVQAASAAPGWSDVGSPADGAGGVAPALVSLGRRLEQSQSVEPVRDSTTMHHHTDSKTLRKERQKKIAQGHAPDDHEEQGPSMSM